MPLLVLGGELACGSASPRPMTLPSLVWGWRFLRQQLVEVDFRAGADAAAYGLPVGDGNLPVLEHVAGPSGMPSCAAHRFHVPPAVISASLRGAILRIPLDVSVVGAYLRREMKVGYLYQSQTSGAATGRIKIRPRHARPAHLSRFWLWQEGETDQGRLRSTGGGRCGEKRDNC
jgi:hypothetical protein